MTSMGREAVTTSSFRLLRCFRSCAPLALWNGGKTRRARRRSGEQARLPQHTQGEFIRCCARCPVATHSPAPFRCCPPCRRHAHSDTLHARKRHDAFPNDTLLPIRPPNPAYPRERAHALNRGRPALCPQRRRHGGAREAGDGDGGDKRTSSTSTRDGVPHKEKPNTAQR